MDDLAAQLIEANRPSAPNVDDIGIPNPPAPDQHPQFWEYLLARIFYFDHQSPSHLHTHPNTPGLLWQGHTPIRRPLSLSDTQALTHYYHRIPENARDYIYRRLLSLTPRLDPTKICVAPGVLWDITNQTFIEDPDILTITEDKVE